MINYTDAQGRSLLSRCLISRKFDLAKEFLEHNAEVNRVGKDGCNEFHYIAANIRYGGVEVARMLLERGVSLMAKDKSYGNTALSTLYLEILKTRSDEEMAFLEDCFRQAESFDVCNKYGNSARKLVNKYGPEKLKEIVEERQ